MKPKPTYSAVPAGSVYYFELIDRNRIDDLVNAFHYQNISEERAEEGIWSLSYWYYIRRKFMITLVTPVGTSLFTNYLDKNPNSVRFELDYNTIKKLAATEWDNYGDEIDDLRCACLEFIVRNGITASAELQSIAKIQDELKDDKIEVRLLASDTIASQLAAEILEEKFKILGDQVSVKFDSSNDVIKGLQVEDPEAFSSKGMTQLIQRINSISGGFVGLAITRNFAINITGGYKATVPYLTILAQLERVALYYNFEDTDALIKIPQAPLVIDWASIERHSDVLMQLDEVIGSWRQFQKQPENYPAIQDLEAFIEADEEVALLSPIGQIFWNHYQKYFVADLPTGKYFSYERDERNKIDKAVEELYGRLDDTLRDSYFNPNASCLCNSNKKDCKNCYCRIRNLGHNDDLNHGGQIPNQNIFIFKSTNDEHIRFLYTFIVKPYLIKFNKKQSDVGEITRLTIYDLHYEDFNHTTYIEDWKDKISSPELPQTDFVPRIFDIPSKILTKILNTRKNKVK